MLECEICSQKLDNLKSYVFHYKLHQNVNNSTFPCYYSGCTRRFRTYASCKCHILRDHRKHKAKQQTQSSPSFSLSCLVSLCDKSFQYLEDFLKHLRGHVIEGTVVDCPFHACYTKLKKKNTFSSHFSRKHRNRSVNSVSQKYYCEPASLVNCENGALVPERPDAVNYESNQDDYKSDDSDQCAQIDFCNIEQQYLRNLALFYLKLQSKLLLPVSTIQHIISGFEDVHSVGQTYVQSKLLRNLESVGVSKDCATDVVEDILKADLFSSCNRGPLRSAQTRNSFFRANFTYVLPIEVFLGRNQFRRQRFYQYIPVIETLKALLQNKSIQDQLSCPEFPQSLTDVHIFNDVIHGKSFRRNPLFKDEPNALKIILYQDSFEVVNPLGSAKKKHKILAVYLTLADIHTYNRSSIDQFQLVLLCTESDFKRFGQKSVFGNLIEDLKRLENNGIAIGSITLKGTVCAILGDNLGSNCIGGFTENFSTVAHFCRFCLVTKSELIDNPYDLGPTRTPDNYDLDAACTDRDINNGVKFQSVFNSLKYFHVCQPGLPPCLGHDLFEGVSSFDLALMIKYFVKTKRFFSYDQLNRDISRFKYLGSDTNNIPAEVSQKGEKAGGHAVQNWCLVRLLPLIVGERISDLDDEVWQLFLQLREIVEIVCAPKISCGQVAYLNAIISDYLDLRHSLFPDKVLKPKHHFLAHYPQLIVQFGPLIRLWTLRFESKHTYFKRCARVLHNYKNLCKTLAEKHQLLQAYLSAGVLFPPTVTLHKGVEFYVESRSEEIKRALVSFNFRPDNTLVSYSVTVKGTNYKKGLYLVLHRDDSGLVFGEIMEVLVQNEIEVFFIVKAFQSVFQFGLNVHCLDKSGEIECCKFDSLIDYYPLPGYEMKGQLYIPLHHAVCI